MFEIEIFNFCLGLFETLKLKSYDDVVSQSAFFPFTEQIHESELIIRSMSCK